MQLSDTILAYLVMGHPKNNPAKLFINWYIGIGVNIILKNFLYLALAAILFIGVERFSVIESQLDIIPVKSKSNWPEILGGDSL